MSTSTRLLAAFVVGIQLFSASAVLAQGDPKREISKISGDLFRFRNNFHYSVFLVTSDGIIATDPINKGAAVWLKRELARRFARPVRYLIYSHDHADHISGGEVFADTAVVVAHEKAKEAIIGKNRPTAVPQIVFSDRLTLELGGQIVELIYVGKNHSDNSIVMRFPAEKALFAVDFIPVRSLPYRDLGDSYVEEWIESLKRVEALEFQTLIPGHGSIGSKADVRKFRSYMEDLWGQVVSYTGQGKSEVEINRMVKMEKYREWSRYKEYLPLNIQGMLRQVTRSK